MIEIEIEDTQLQEALERLAMVGAKTLPALQEAGEFLVETTKRRFRSKKAPDGSPWPDNSIITQARKGGKNDPLIGESKRLSREIHYRAREGLLEVGSSLEYAATQQFGARKGSFGSSKTGDSIPWGNIPPRAFIGLSPDDRAGVLDILATAIRKHIEQ